MEGLPMELIQRILEEGVGMEDTDNLSLMNRQLRDATAESRGEVRTAKSKVRRALRAPRIVEEGEYPNPLRRAIFEAKREGGGSLFREDGSMTRPAKNLKFFIDGRRGHMLVDGLGRPIDRGRQRVAHFVVQ